MQDIASNPVLQNKNIPEGMLQGQDINEIQLFCNPFQTIYVFT
jgi:hypothetical protein